MKLFKYRTVGSQMILAMSRSRSDIAADLEETTRKLCQHLMKLYLYPNTEYVNGWRKEVYNFLHEIPVLRGKNRYPSQQFILDNTINPNAMRLQYWVEVVESDNDKLQPLDYRYEDLVSAIYDYYYWLSAMLAQKGQVKRADVYAQLNLLGF